MSREFQCLAQGLLEKLRSITNEVAQHRQHVKIPPFLGKYDPEAYLEWEKNVELVFDWHDFFKKKKVRLASIELDDYAVMWWDQLCIDRRRNGEGPIDTWAEMKRVMRRRFVPSHYYRNLDLQWLHRSDQNVNEYSQELSTLMSRGAPQTTGISHLGSREEDGSIVVPKAKMEAKTTIAIEASQGNSNAHEIKLAEKVNKSEVMSSVADCKCVSIQDEIEDAKHALVDRMTLSAQMKTRADMLFEPKLVLNCMEITTPYILECSNEVGEVRIGKGNDMQSLPHMGVYEDPFLVYMTNVLNLLRGIDHQVDNIFDPGDWPPLHMRFSNFPSHRKAILDSRGKDSGRIFFEERGNDVRMRSYKDQMQRNQFKSLLDRLQGPKPRR